MALTIEGGVAQAMDNERIEVKLGATLKNESSIISTGGISIKVLGGGAHVLQFFKRSFYSADDGMLSGKTLTNRNTLAELTTDENAPKWHVDTADNKNPYYDFHAQSPCVRTGSSLTIYDKPDLVRSNTILSMTTLKDWSKFTALSFCIADGETAAVIEWTVRKVGKGAEEYAVRKLPRDNVQILAANLLIAAEKFPPGIYIPLRPIVGGIEAPTGPKIEPVD